MTELGQVGIIFQSVGVEPPAAQQRSNERSHQGTDVDENVENLETGITLSLCPLQAFGTLLGGAGFEVVVHLSYDSLQVALEKTITTGNQCQCEDGERQQPRDIVGSGQYGNSQQDIAYCHHHQTPCYRGFVVLGAVGNDTAYQTEHIDSCEEHGCNESALSVGQSELRTQEQCQYGIHDIVAKTLAHITEGCEQKPFRMVFEHVYLILGFLLL